MGGYFFAVYSLYIHLNALNVNPFKYRWMILKWRMDNDGFECNGVGEFNLRRVEGLAFENWFPPIKHIPRQWVSNVAEMDPDLVRPAGFEPAGNPGQPFLRVGF